MRASVTSLSKKFISTFFAATLALGLVPAAAFAVDDETVDPADSAAERPDIISNTVDLEPNESSVLLGKFQDEPEETGFTPAAEKDETDVAIGNEFVTPILATTERVNEDVVLTTPVAQQESTRTYFLAQTLESTHTVPMLSANLSISTDDEAVRESAVLGSFEYFGMTFAVEADGESVALVAIDYSKLPSDFIEKQVVAIPASATPGGAEYYDVTRIADGALVSLSKQSANPDYVGCEALLSSEERLTEADTDLAEIEALLNSGEEMIDIDGDGEVDTVANPFKDCTGILALDIPWSVAVIEDGAFAGSDTLQYIIVSDENLDYASFDGALYSADLTQLRLIPEGRVGAVRVASSTTVVKSEVFSHCPSVDTVVVDPDSGIISADDMESLGIRLLTTDLSFETSSRTLLATYEGWPTVDVYLNGGTISCHDGPSKGASRTGEMAHWNYVKKLRVYHMGHLHMTLTNDSYNMWNISRKGYSFASWSGTVSLAFTPGASSSLFVDKTEDCTLYANWSANQYDVSFNANGGSGGQSALVKATYDSKMPTISTTPPTRAGYTFKGWWDTSASEGGTQYYTEGGASANTWDKTSNTTLYARWRQDTKLSFDLDIKYNVTASPVRGAPALASTVNTRVYTNSSPFTLPNISQWLRYNPNNEAYLTLGYGGGWSGRAYDVTVTPVCSGYRASVGYSSPTSTVYDGVQTTVVVYCKAIANKYTVTFERGGATDGTASQPVTYNAAVSDIDVPTRKGYNFTGYYESVDANGNGVGSAWFDRDGIYVRTKTSPDYTGEVAGRRWATTSNKTLYAGWESTKHEITWNTQGGSASLGDDLIYQPEGADLEVPVAVRRGYAFAGWWTEPEDEEGMRVGSGHAITQVPDHDVIYFAHWDEVEGRAYLNATSEGEFTQKQVEAYNAVEGNPSAVLVDSTEVEITYTVDTETFSLDGLHPTLRGAVFAGWDPAVSAPSWIEEKESYAEMKYTATWDPNAYEVTYRDKDRNPLVGWAAAKGGLSLESVLLTCFNEATPDAERTLPEKPYKLGYTWVEWIWVHDDDTEEVVTSIPDVSSDITIVANFVADEYSVDIDLGGGAGTDWPKEYKGNYDNPIIELPADKPKREGYLFLGLKAYASEAEDALSVDVIDRATNLFVDTLQSGNAYRVLNLADGEGAVYDVKILRAVWTPRIAVDVSPSIDMGILADFGSNTLKFQCGGTDYVTGNTENAYAPLEFVSYTTAPVGIVAVSDDTEDVTGYAVRKAFAERIFGSAFNAAQVSFKIATDRTGANSHSFSLGGSTEPDPTGILQGLTIANPTGAESSKTSTFYLGMDFGSLTAMDLLAEESGQIAKLYYTVALVGDPKNEPSKLVPYDGDGILWYPRSSSSI